LTVEKIHAVPPSVIGLGGGAGWTVAMSAARSEIIS